MKCLEFYIVLDEECDVITTMNSISAFKSINSEFVGFHIKTKTKCDRLSQKENKERFIKILYRALLATHYNYQIEPYIRLAQRKYQP